jgi:hypothetical protein
MLLDEVGKEEQLQNHEDDKQLNQDNSPEGTPQFHVAEPVVIEVKNPVEKAFFTHRFFC